MDGSDSTKENPEEKQTLADLGERHIIEELIHERFEIEKPGWGGLGDDCAIFDSPSSGSIALTTDPCPTPITWLLNRGEYSDWGWYSAIINLSDLAASGAEPIGMVVSIEVPEDLETGQFIRLLDGIEEASKRWNCPVLGGNVKDAPEISITGAALGKKDPVLGFSRAGAQPEDKICVIGEMGRFWSLVLSEARGISLPETLYPGDQLLRRPEPKLDEALSLADEVRINSCIDNSDGITAGLYRLATASRVRMVIDNQSLMNNVLPSYPDVEYVCDKLDLDPRKLLLSWGGWELICTIPAEDVERAEAQVQDSGCPFWEVGEVRQGSESVLLETDAGEDQLADIGSYRFEADSLFSHGLESYIETLLEGSIINRKRSG